MRKLRRYLEPTFLLAAGSGRARIYLDYQIITPRYTVSPVSGSVIPSHVVTLRKYLHHGYKALQFITFNYLIINRLNTNSRFNALRDTGTVRRWWSYNETETPIFIWTQTRPSLPLSLCRCRCVVTLCLFPELLTPLTQLSSPPQTRTLPDIYLPIITSSSHCFNRN